MRHRAKQSYKVFWKWQKVLTCRTTSIVKRLAFWNKTVAMSLTWGLETTRSSKTNHKILQQTQRMQVVKMMGLKRKKYDGGILEEWLEWHIRRFHEAKRLIEQCKADIVQYLKHKREHFVDHIKRFGTAGKEEHIVKHILLWRSLTWWRIQQEFNDTLPDHDQFLHPQIFGHPRRYESQFKKNYLFLNSIQPDGES